MARGKKPTVAQCNLLSERGYKSKDWLYTGESVVQDGESKGLSKNEFKIVRLKFVHRTTGQEIFLEK